MPRKQNNKISVLFFFCLIVFVTPVIANAQFTKSPDVSLIWQADSYTPPFYLGKALKPAESSVILLAVPNIIQNGSRLPASSLVFTWKKDGVVLGSQSGVGRDTLIVPGSILSRPIDIFVTVQTQSGNIEAQRGIRIPVTTPLVRLYENNPLEGIRFGSALENIFRLQDEETTIEAFPLFFSVNNRQDALSYEWRIGGQLLTAETAPRITLREVGESGQIPISTRITNNKNLLEEINMTITVDFGR